MSENLHNSQATSASLSPKALLSCKQSVHFLNLIPIFVSEYFGSPQTMSDAFIGDGTVSGRPVLSVSSWQSASHDDPGVTRRAVVWWIRRSHSSILKPDAMVYGRGRRTRKSVGTRVEVGGGPGHGTSTDTNVRMSLAS